MQGGSSEVGLTISRRALKKLGERLAAEISPADYDLDLLAAVLDVYDRVLGKYSELIRALELLNQEIAQS
jgi:hypothetical protein